ncbi:GrrA/OscA1 family cyclophane-containing rSAM-modified RiPP [Geminocystis herdmanii]|uniref:GrrA/OscA1 family cyclophane-containing rSAM-modified RiPP n=1 Tax=Geminocystis herdmanii TaxID=669359 RepID=UPI00034954A3|nr:GrrA/OscA1 family cyclophane-containing rSAM-modified RiPP [Geminocystis herdmanii]
MKINNLTWLGFLITLSSLSVTPKTLAINPDVISTDVMENVENRLNRISEALKAREGNLPIDIKNSLNQEILARSFINGGSGWRNGGGFLNNRGGGGFVNTGGGSGFFNNRGWGDGGGFLNRR